MDSVPLMFPMADMESGKLEDDFSYRNNVAQAHLHIRHGFLRKVYGLLTVQLFITTVFSAVIMFWPSGKLYVANSPWMLLVAFMSTFVLLIALHIKRRETPTNFILLMAFTVAEAYTIAVVVSFYDQLVVLEAFLLTLAVTVCLTLFTFQTKRNFTSAGAGLFSALMILVVAGFLHMFLASAFLEIVISIGGAILFSLFIIYDTQMLMPKLSAEEYIEATISLYLDIINLFLYILRILEAARRS